MPEPVFHLRPDYRAPPCLRAPNADTLFSNAGNPLESLLETIMAGDNTAYDPMTHLCLVVAVRVAAAEHTAMHEWAAHHITLPRNPHIIGWSLPEYLWPGAEADLYLCRVENRWFETLASVTTAGSLRDDATPIRPPTPMAQAWCETAERYRAKPAVWRLAGDDLVYRTLRNRSDEIRPASGRDPADVDRSIADMERWSAAQAEAALRQAARQPGMTWCPAHRKVHALDRPCWGCSRNAGLN